MTPLSKKQRQCAYRLRKERRARLIDNTSAALIIVAALLFVVSLSSPDLNGWFVPLVDAVSKPCAFIRDWCRGLMDASAGGVLRWTAGVELVVLFVGVAVIVLREVE